MGNPRASKISAAGGPDPHSLKAFLSEFRQGKQRGQEEAISGGPVHQYKAMAEDEMVEAAQEIKALLNRVIQMGQRGSVRLNDVRFASTLSTHLSTLLYNAGRASGLDT